MYMRNYDNLLPMVTAPHHMTYHYAKYSTLKWSVKPDITLPLCIHKYVTIISENSIQQ